jgi:hypothetical protein
MPFLDHDYVNEVIARLERIQPDAKPAWGSMSRADMISHLADWVRLSMGRTDPLPDQSTWLSRNILRHAMLHGVLPIPKGLSSPRMQKSPTSDLETFHALLEDYLAHVQSGDLQPPPHPFFGPLGVDGWARIHLRHFEHHLRQFGA